MLGVGEHRLFAALRDMRVLNAQNIPYQTYITRGYIRVHHGMYERPDGSMHHYARAQITGAGLTWLAQKLTIINIPN